MHRCCAEQHTHALSCKIYEETPSRIARGGCLFSSEIQDLHVRRMPQSRAFPTRCRVDTDNGDIVLSNLSALSILISKIDRALPFERSLLLGLVFKLHSGYSTRTHTTHKLSCFFSREILWVAILKRNWGRTASNDSFDLKVSCLIINTSRFARDNPSRHSRSRYVLCERYLKVYVPSGSFPNG